ncbi:MAG: hypothetical protein ACRCTY_04990, partial [Candidatus Adiutrix sp.]
LFIELFDEIYEVRLANIIRLEAKLKTLSTAKERLFCLYSDYANRGYEHSQELLFWKRCTLFPPKFYRKKINAALMAYQREFIYHLLEPVILMGIEMGELKKQNANKCIVAFLAVIGAVFNEIHYSCKETYEEKLKILWDFFWDSLKAA